MSRGSRPLSHSLSLSPCTSLSLVRALTHTHTRALLRRDAAGGSPTHRSTRVRARQLTAEGAHNLLVSTLEVHDLLVSARRRLREAGRGWQVPPTEFILVYVVNLVIYDSGQGTLFVVCPSPTLKC